MAKLTRKHRMLQRPEDFSLDHSHPLAKGLVFAGLGNTPKGISYRDSSLYKNNGTLTNFAWPNTGSSGWGWGNTLKRPVITYDGSNDYIQVASALPASFPVTLPYTFSCWFTQVDWAALGTGRHHYIDVCDGANVKISLGWFSGSEEHPSEIVAHDWLNGKFKRIFTAAFAANSLHHILAEFRSTAITNLWVDGVLATSGYWGMSGNSAGVKIGARGGPAEYTAAGTIADPIIWGDAKSQYVSQLADPGWSIDYGGLILPVWQRVFAAGVAGGPDAWTDNLSVSASVAVSETDALVASDSLAVAATGVVTETDAQVVADALSVSATAAVTETDAMAAADNLSVAASAVVVDADAFAGTDSLSVAASGVVTVTDGQALLDSLAVAASGAVTEVDAFAGSDALAVSAAAVVVETDVFTLFGGAGLLLAVQSHFMLSA